MEVTEIFERYIAKAGVTLDIASVTATVLPNVSALFAEAKSALPSSPLTAAQLESLFRYKVPFSGPDGACSLSKALDPTPFDLGRDAFGPDYDITSAECSESTLALRLFRLNELVRRLSELTLFDWLGVYRAVSPSDGGAAYLVKEAYVGAPSRAKFPLTNEFAEMSNNSTVGLTGKAKLVQSVGDYEGPYYVCDARVQSELCAPIFSPDGTRVIGIIDAEAFASGFLTPERTATVLLVCALLGESNLLCF
eukprot:Opistho-2@71009